MIYNEIKKEIKSGTAFFGTLDDAPEHIHIVLTDPIPDERDKKSLQVIVVNLTSVYKKGTREKVSDYDPTVVLTKRDHRIISRESFVYYKKAKVITRRYLRRKERSGRLQGRKDFKGDILQEMINGLLDSPKTRDPIRDFYRKYLKYKKEEKYERFMYHPLKEDEWKKPSIWDLDFRKNFEWKRDIWD